ncbi:GNAT family N-acetyltransferase [Vulgatibacter incomptus]|uniref:Acetyltransferase, GNAT family n=1 Tax=Vulgatibacter incomptus TaxID=1391653 RepID=A0A0K1PEB3_9BACT|nr:GNAT family N-acetyltransferase [Vulgatibacter incomptus]AKU91878.1 Acetyltransferase, GNAT family [Vulgatibacter incomptus]
MYEVSTPIEPHWTARTAEAADYEFFLRCLSELASDDPVPSKERWLASYAPNTVILEAEGKRVGYGYAWSFGEWSHVSHVVVDPESRGRGVGDHLMRVLAARLHAAGSRNWRLHVRPANEPALRLYRAFGLSKVYPAWLNWLGREALSSLPSANPEWIRAEVDPDEEEALELRWNLLPGSIRRFRAPGRHVVRLVAPEHAGDPAPALALFDPAYSGASVFRCRSPSLVRPIVEELFALTPSDAPRISIFVEEDAWLSRLLVDAGATLRMEVLQMRGAIPSVAEAASP